MASYWCTYDDVKSAAEDIRPHIHRTPLVTCSTLDKMAGRKLFLKTENFQKTGSFKFRGVANAVTKLMKGESKPKCVITESGGNLGQALAKATCDLGIQCFVVMSEGSVESKVKAIEGYGGKIFKANPSADARTDKVREIMKEMGAHFIDATQDHDLVAGYGTIAVEILDDNPDIDVIMAPVGGGSLISGIAIAAKAIKPSIKVIASEPENADDCFRSKIKGEMLSNSKDQDTIADGVRCDVYSNAWPVIRDLVDDVITVSEEDIVKGMMTVWERAKLVVEPTTGVSIAAVLSEKFKKIEGQNVAVVLCGGNVDFESMPSLLQYLR